MDFSFLSVSRRRLLQVIASAIPFLASSHVASAEGRGMEAYLWKKRPLLIFAPRRRFSAFLRQTRLLSGRGNRLRERDIVVVLVPGARVSAQYGEAPDVDAAALRRTFGVADDAFATILVGKDGDVKHQFDAPVTAERLLDLVDKMPMRLDEIKEQQNATQ